LGLKRNCRRLHQNPTLALPSLGREPCTGGTSCRHTNCLGGIKLVIAKEVAQAVIRTEAARSDNLPAARPTRDDDDCTREKAAVADKDVIAVIAHAPPTIVADQFGDSGVARPCFARHLDRRGVLLQRATGVAQPRPMHTGATIQLPTAAAKLGVFLAMIQPTDGARLDADRTDHYGVVVCLDVAGGQVGVTEAVMALVFCGKMVGAEEGVAEITLTHTLFAAFFATLGAEDGVGGKLPAARTFF
jgi:hypothetical protein